jgi:hypothetical protein
MFVSLADDAATVIARAFPGERVFGRYIDWW